MASQTNLSVAVLRAWEARFGFPTPTRLSGGHRRYSVRQVEQIQQVQRERDTGLGLSAAIARVVADGDGAVTSIFAGLRQRWPQLTVHVLSKRALLAISRAIEDECCAQAKHPVIVGSFQREHYYRQSELRWQELARTASSAIVFADFPQRRQREGSAAEIPVAADASLLREWAVICDASNFSACVAGVERPGRTAHGRRRFETVWSVDRAVVGDALAIADQLAGGGHDHRTGPSRPLLTADPSLLAGAALLGRIVAYLDV